MIYSKKIYSKKRSSKKSHSKKSQEGLKLIELVLAMAVAGSILYYSMLQYLSYRRDADIYQVRYNVDLLFQSLSLYFRANCGQQGNVLNSDYAAQSFAVTIPDLIKEGYLTSQLTASPLIQQKTAKDGYVLQFNQLRPLPKRQMGIYSNPVETPAVIQQTTIGYILMWEAQVSVNLKNTDTAKQYQMLLQADCLSVPGASQTVQPCTPGPAAGNASYAVWERLPSFSSSQINSTYWASMPLVKQFTQMYTTYPILVLTDGTYTNTQYFVCGS